MERQEEGVGKNGAVNTPPWISRERERECIF